MAHERRPLLAAFLSLWLACAGQAADWARVTELSRGVTRAEFDRLLDHVFAPSGELRRYLREKDPDVLEALEAPGGTSVLARLEFAAPNATPPPLAAALAAWCGGEKPEGKPLAGLRLALDPGHIGGSWARMENRLLYASRSDWFVQEAAMNLHVARLAAARLRALGAEVQLVKDDLNPVTPLRPEDFMKEAEQYVGTVQHFDHLPELFREATRLDAVRRRAELRFYRDAEIRARAERINASIQPHLTVCIHFNAHDTVNPRELVDQNGLAIFISGNYLPDELADPEQRAQLLLKLLEGAHQPELAAAQALEGALVKETGLAAAYQSRGGVMQALDDRWIIYARNLAANRLVRGPVVFLEAYFMNNRDVYQRIQAGDYEGTRTILGREVKSIYHEYADGICAGLVEFARGLPAP